MSDTFKYFQRPFIAPQLHQLFLLQTNLHTFFCNTMTEHHISHKNVYRDVWKYFNAVLLFYNIFFGVWRISIHLKLLICYKIKSKLNDLDPFKIMYSFLIWDLIKDTNFLPRKFFSYSSHGYQQLIYDPRYSMLTLKCIVIIAYHTQFYFHHYKIWTHIGIHTKVGGR